MIIVSDTSPIANLIIVGQGHLLQQLYTEVIVPKQVEAEIQAGLKLRGIDVSPLNWLAVKSPQDQALVQSLMLELDEGEAEAITLARELKADLLLMGERKGRYIAERFGVPVIGLLGVLLEAKQNKLIDKLQPILDALIHQAGFWIAAELYERVLQLAKE